jgi:hypothetical protein
MQLLIVIIFLIVLIVIIVSRFFNDKGNLQTFEMSREIDAPKNVVWHHISKVGDFHKVARNLHHVDIISGEGVGMVRRCTDNRGKTWTETCTAWNPGDSYTFEVNTKAKNYPFPVDKLIGNFAAEWIDGHRTRLVIRFQFELKYKLITWVFSGKIKTEADKNMKAMLDLWGDQILADRNVTGHQSK